MSCRHSPPPTTAQQPPHWARRRLPTSRSPIGGPIFPLRLAVAVLGVLVLEPLGVPTELAAVAGITIVSSVFLRGRVLPAVVLSLHTVPASYADNDQLD